MGEIAMVKKKYQVTLLQFSFAFIPFAFLLSLALLAPEATLDMTFYRTVYTIWVAVILVTPALCAFVLPGDSETKQNIWLLFWTVSFIAYLTHLAYAYFGVYNGSFQQFLVGQGMVPAMINGAFTLWWAFDLAVAWWYNGTATWVKRQRVWSHLFIGLTFFVSTVFLKRGFVNILGILMSLAVGVSILFRIDAWRAMRRSALSAP